MTENLFSVDATTSEGKSTIINVRSEADFIQKGKITKLEIVEDKGWMAVEFTNDKGLTSNKNFFFPKDNGDAEKYAKAVKFFMGNIANIGRRYKGTDYKVSGIDALDVAKKMVKDVTSLLNKEVFCLMELNEGKDGKIYTNVGSFSPLSDTGKDLFITDKQRKLLEKKLNWKGDDAKPDVDTQAPATTADF